MSGKVQFDVQHLYYLPQYLPVAQILRTNNIQCEFILHRERELDALKAKRIENEGFSFQFIEDKSKTFSLYRNSTADWVVFGNIPYFSSAQKSLIKPRLALMQHGIGPKSCYYKVSRFPFDVRFVEGQKRLKRLQAMYPDANFFDTGYAKLDPLFNGAHCHHSIETLGLDKNKPTVLYAPTYFPSSIERFPQNWPLMLNHMNIIIKPHFFSLTRTKYQSQKLKMEHWNRYNNVYLAGVEDFDLLPFMHLADVMLSDASSAIFEFAATNKPIVWCDFFCTRWSYAGLFKFRLKQRLDSDIMLFNDISHRACNAAQANALISKCLESPFEKKLYQQKITQDMVGKTDGKCSFRVAEYLKKN